MPDSLSPAAVAEIRRAEKRAQRLSSDLALKSELSDSSTQAAVPRQSPPTLASPSRSYLSEASSHLADASAKLERAIMSPELRTRIRQELEQAKMSPIQFSSREHMASSPAQSHRSFTQDSFFEAPRGPQLMDDGPWEVVRIESGHGQGRWYYHQPSSGYLTWTWREYMGIPRAPDDETDALDTSGRLVMVKATQ